MRIDQHVLQFEKKARIELLALLLRYEHQFRQYIRQYPVEIEGIVAESGDYYRAVLAANDSEGFTFEGWTTALWQSL